MSSGKKALVQGVLGFGSPLMRVERAPTPVAVPSPTPTQAEAVKREKSLPLVVDQERPVKLALSFGFACIKVTLSVRKQEVVLSSKRRKDYDKMAILKQVAHVPKHAHAAAFLNTISGYEKINGQMIGAWRKEAAASSKLEEAAAGAASEGASGSSSRKRKRKPKHGGGRKVNAAFEEAVRDELIFTSLEKVDDKVKAVVEANVAFSHALIIRAAQKVQQTERFQDDRKVQALKFRRTWIAGWLRRQVLRRRRITASEKDLPAPLVVQSRMAEIQNTIVSKSFTKAVRLSARTRQASSSALRRSIRSYRLMQRAQRRRMLTRRHASPQCSLARLTARWVRFGQSSSALSRVPTFRLLACSTHCTWRRASRLRRAGCCACGSAHSL